MVISSGRRDDGILIIDLLKLPDDQPILIDLGIMPEFILPFIPEERMH
jgi:hypothetical protein